MSQKTPEVKPDESLPSPWRCWYGTLVAGAMSIAAYFITSKVVLNFASNPPTGNTLAVKIGITVRTLVTGVSTMATAIFGIIAIGLFFLGFQSLLAANKTAPSKE